MSTTRAFLLLPLSLGFLGAAAFQAVPVALLTAVGVEAEAARAAAPLVTAGLAAVGFVLLVLALVAAVGTHTRTERAQPYREALRSFAAEFGRAVDFEAGVVGVDIQRDGQRVEVRIDPALGLITVRSPPPARQLLAWTAANAETPAPARGWREVERVEAWRMHAELPVMARPLLADAKLMEVVGLFFQRREARSITHTLAGMVVEAALPGPRDADAVVRVATEITFRLRRVNG